MLILSLDTTTRAGSCALWRDGALIEERAGDAARTHAERLPGDLADLLAAHGLKVGDVELYAVASGPGSFTGLRVGIATIQALALVHSKKVVPISAFEALAHAAPCAFETGLIGTWMEAYRGEVFGALYRKDAQEMFELAEPAVATPKTMAGEWQRIWDRDSSGAQIGGVIIGDAVPGARDLLAAAFPNAQLLDPVPLAGTIARLADAHRDRAVRPHAIVPLYVRRPDAELARDRASTPHPQAT